MSEWRCPNCDDYCPGCRRSSPEELGITKGLTAAKMVFLKLVFEVIPAKDVTRFDELHTAWMVYNAHKIVAEEKRNEAQGRRQKAAKEAAKVRGEINNKQQEVMSIAVKQNKEYAKRISELEAEVARLNCLLTPVTETRNQKIVNDALRSNGGIVRPSADGKRYRGMQP